MGAMNRLGATRSVRRRPVRDRAGCFHYPVAALTLRAKTAHEGFVQ